MRRAERLFQLTNLLRNRRTVITARQLADVMEVSERTVYRDIQALSLSGVPIEGEAGVGYRLARRFDLPPLMFDSEEVEALLLGTKMVRGWSDQKLAQAANSALLKILAVLPEQLRHSDEETMFFVPTFGDESAMTEHSELIRSAIKRRQVLDMGYVRADGCASQRRVQPLGLCFWGNTWTLVSWCCLRDEYRMFRLDRISSLNLTGEEFTIEEDKNLSHYMQQEREKMQCDKADELTQFPA